MAVYFPVSTARSPPTTTEMLQTRQHITLPSTTSTEFSPGSYDDITMCPDAMRVAQSRRGMKESARQPSAQEGPHPVV